MFDDGGLQLRLHLASLHLSLSLDEVGRQAMEYLREAPLLWQTHILPSQGSSKVNLSYAHGS